MGLVSPAPSLAPVWCELMFIRSETGAMTAIPVGSRLLRQGKAARLVKLPLKLEWGKSWRRNFIAGDCMLQVTGGAGSIGSTFMAGWTAHLRGGEV